MEFPQNRARRPFGVSPALVLVTLAVFLIPGWNTALQLDRAGVAAGEWWLLLTGHFTHWNPDHLTWDLIAFAILATFCESRSSYRLRVCLGLSAVTIALGFLLLETELATYRGLSGLDSALFGLAMVELCRRPGAGRGVAIVGLAGFLGKTLFEVTCGATVFVASGKGGFLPVPSAHLLGFLCGLAAGVCPRGAR